MRECAHGLSTLPFIGIGHHFLGSNQTRMKALQMLGLESNRIGGMLAGWFGPFPYVGISDPVIAEVVLRECLDKDYVMKILRTVIGHGLIVAPLSVWRSRRKVLVPTFMSKNLRQFLSIFSKNSQILVEKLKENVGKGSFPIWSYVAANNMDTVCEAVFGLEMHIQQNHNHPFLLNFNNTSKLLGARLCQPWLHSDMVYKLLPQQKALTKGVKVMYETVDDIIKRKNEDLQKNIDNKDRKNGMRPFLELLMESSAQQDGPYNHQELREETLTLTIAGADTSAAGAAFVLLALSKHQDVQEKMYQEIKEVFGDSTENVTMEDLKRLVYTEAAIKEGMRLYPSAPVILRRVQKDVTLPSGVTLPAGVGILINIWGIHRNRKYWGEDADEFRPERFLDTPFKHPAQYMVFSYGPRNCPGERYAMLVMKTVVATLLNHYRILPGSGEPRLSFDLMMKDADDYRVQIELRNPTNCEANQH
ncbi:cytochrome p450 domain-containing protein [Phthorimaea operculella]|nr:cytochrome p450 domain-containing protein [Phthorimaea operculella]